MSYALVTGASKGIGKEIAMELADRGYELLLVARNSYELQQVKEEIQKKYAVSVDYLVVDLSEPTSVERLFNWVLEKQIDLRILVNNAGIDPRKTWNEITVADWDHVMATNVRSQFICAKAVFPLMKQQDYGKIINVSSVVFLTGQKGYVHYVTSKGAIIGFTRALANEIGMHHINVNAIILGAIHTENELEKLGSLEAQEKATNMLMDIQAIPQRIQTSDIEGTFVFLASADSDLITGQSMNIDGGWMMH